MKFPGPSSFRSSLLPISLLLLSQATLAASVTGSVTDKTINKPSAGDDVVLIGLTQKMQEITRTKTDRTGHYHLDIPDDGMHLVRVDHQKASYFAPIAPGATKVDVTVYDVAPKVEGLTMEADMLRIETDGQGLHVIESYFLKNDSVPPRTQFGPKSFEIYLPDDAKIDASIAMGPGGMPVASAPAAQGDAGHYAFIFPVRPGETQFQIEYHLPRSDSHTFDARVSVPTTNYAVVLPESMTLTPKNGAVFGPMSGDPNTRSLVAKNLQPGTPLTFTVAGSGTLPQNAASGQASADNGNGSGSAAAPADTRPGGGMAAPIDTPDPLDKYKWWILSGIAIVLAVGAGIFLRSRPASIAHPMDVAAAVSIRPRNEAPSNDAWLAGLKEELFSLETERLRGTLPPEEYQLQKGALEVVMRRALARAAKPQPPTPTETQQSSSGDPIVSSLSRTAEHSESIG